jgi:hypothetical protein
VFIKDLEDGFVLSGYSGPVDLLSSRDPNHRNLRRETPRALHVRALMGEAAIAEGTHERAIIDVKHFGEQAGSQ